MRIFGNLHKCHTNCNYCFRCIDITQPPTKFYSNLFHGNYQHSIPQWYKSDKYHQKNIICIVRNSALNAGERFWSTKINKCATCWRRTKMIATQTCRCRLQTLELIDHMKIVVPIVDWNSISIVVNLIWFRKQAKWEFLLINIQLYVVFAIDAKRK